MRREVALGMMLAALMVLCSIHPEAWGDCEISGLGDLVTVNPHAQGTKLKGSITIYYQKVEPQPDPNPCLMGTGPVVTMSYFMRLHKGNKTKVLYPFAGKAESVCYRDVEQQQGIIGGFIQTKVIPFIFPDALNATFELKAFEDLVQDIPIDPRVPDCCNGMWFAIADLVIAVQD